MIFVNGLKTHIFNHDKLSKHEADTMQDPILYMSTVEALQYVTLTQLDIS